jgi:uncharacterized protein (TIGR00255 family)
MKSMTAFSRYQLNIEQMLITWEIKSVNHRFLDQFYRLPEQYRAIEPQLRQLISQYLNRGRLEINLQVKSTQSSALPSLNEEALKDLVRLSELIANRYQIANDLTVQSCLRIPNIWGGNDFSLSTEHQEIIVSSFKQALEILVSYRQQEGLAIQQLLLERINKLQSHVEQIRGLVQDALPQLKQRLHQKIDNLYDGKFDEQRLEQELVIQVMRIDIAEELDRLSTHLNELRRVVIDDACHGRRLDFLVQELHRETNTIGSKTDSIAISQLIIDMKVFIEQMREQIQNVE